MWGVKFPTLFKVGVQTDLLFPKKFPENFIDGINPPKTPVKVSYRGGYGRGDPHIGGYAILPPEGKVWITYAPSPRVIVSCG